MIAYSTGGLIFAKLGVKGAQKLGLSITTFSGLLILTIGLRYQESWFFPCMIMGAKIGVTLSMGLCYLSNSHLFPTLFAATAFGMCNIMARVFTAMSSLMA